MGFITQEELTYMSRLILPDDFRAQYSPQQALANLFNNYTEEQLAQQYNTTEDLMTRFVNYAIPCIWYELEETKKLAQPVEPWALVYSQW